MQLNDYLLENVREQGVVDLILDYERQINQVEKTKKLKIKSSQFKFVVHRNFHHHPRVPRGDYRLWINVLHSLNLRFNQDRLDKIELEDVIFRRGVYIHLLKLNWRFARLDVKGSKVLFYTSNLVDYIFLVRSLGITCSEDGVEFIDVGQMDDD